MPLILDVTLRNDPNIKLIMEYSTRYDCYRICAIAYGSIGPLLWNAMQSTAGLYEVSSEAEFVQLLTGEYEVVAAAPADSHGALVLQPTLGRYLSIMLDEGVAALQLRPGNSIRLFWSGPGQVGAVYEDTIDSFKESLALPPR